MVPLINRKRVPLLHNTELILGDEGYWIGGREHETSNNVVCATSKDSDQPAHTRSLIRAFASRLSILGLLSY